MIVTSANSVTHRMKVNSLTKIGQVDSNLDVISSAGISIGSTIGFAHTVTGTGVGTDGSGITTTTTYRIESTTNYTTVNFDTVGIATTSFIGISSLTESTVLGWIPSNTLAGIQTANENKLLEEKDRVLNPLKYEIGPASLPWS